MSRVLPILFNTDMVRAILDGRKTVTRRVVKPQIPNHCPSCLHIHDEFIYDELAENVYCAVCGEPFEPEIRAPYQPGDILYVRETWNETTHGYNYKASPLGNSRDTYPWKPSIHMPKEAARLWLKVTDVWVERLQDITEEQTEKEGCNDYTSTANGFCYLWDSTIKKPDLDRYGWCANPWVWVIEFERCEKPEESPYAWNNAIRKLMGGEQE